jgi:hypothetical protein
VASDFFVKKTGGKTVKKHLIQLGLGLILAVGTVTAVFATNRLTTAPPVQGNKLAVVVSADTVTGGGNPAPANTCAQTNYFKRGQLIVFRMWGVNVKSGGKALTGANVVSAVVKIPGEKAIPMAYGAHPPGSAHQVSYWDGTFMVPATYPLGVVNFRIVVKTMRTKLLPSLTGTFSQNGFSPSSRLQITT